jgi:Icc protein
MEQISRQKFLKYLGLTSASLLLPRYISAQQTASLSDQKVIHTHTGPTENTPSPQTPVVRIAHLTDIHIEEGKDSVHGFTSALKAVNDSTLKPDLILNGGDAIMNSGLNLSRERVKDQWKLFHSILGQENSIPLRHCLGNHDLYGWTSPDTAHAKGKKWAMEEYQLERPYYSFQQANWKFIVLDSIHGRNTIPGYYARLDEEQLVWLKQELQQTPADVFICIITHIPILAICTLFESRNHSGGEHWNIPNNTLHADADELTALFYQYPNIRTCLSGHIHMIDHVNYLGIDYYCNGAVSGSWWKGNYKQFPPSYSDMAFYANGKVERKISFYNWQSAS